CKKETIVATSTTEAEYDDAAANCHGQNSATSQTINNENQIHAIVDGKKVVITESSVRKDLLFTDANGITCLTNEQIFENLLLMGPRQTLEGTGFPQTRGPNFPDPNMDVEAVHKEGITVWCGGAMAQVRPEGTSIQSINPHLSAGHTVGNEEDRMEHEIVLTDPIPQPPHDSPLLGGHIPRSDEGSMTLKELTNLCTTLLQKTGTSKRYSLGWRKVFKQERKNWKSQQKFQDIDDLVDEGINFVLDEDADTEMIVDDKGNGEKEEAQQKELKEKAAGSCLKYKSPKKKKVNNKESKDSDKEHRKCLKVVPDDDKAIDYEILDVKSPIVDCESQVLGTNETSDVNVYKLITLDGSYRHFSTFSRMLEVLDRQDVLDLHEIVMERFPDSDTEGYDLILWGDLKTLMEASKDDEI
nr:hypothetical protein [Tanacetum cinerariifolium]